jgi:hypothetical protein
MAIAPFEEDHGTTSKATERSLRVIPGGRSVKAAPRRSAIHAAPPATEIPRSARAAHPSAQRPEQSRRLVRTVDPVTLRDPRTARLARPVLSARTRRSRAALAVSVLAALVLLALPIRALGAVTLAGQATPGGVPAGLAPGSTYVVQAGDTIASLARRINPGDAAQLDRSLVAEVGSSTLVPGEHVVVP